jgi:2-amino-4-hydroxy-6-hydroxymethyldihydropteridine diphosphokinase
MGAAHVVYLGLGTNLGDKEANIREAVKRIRELVGAVMRQSALYFSEPWGFQSDNSFVNAVVCCSTSLSPHEVLDITQKIEIEMGRRQKSSRDGSGKPVYHDRIIDIDILLYDDISLDTPDLVIPHPLINQREFVNIPLREIFLPKN